MNLLDLIAATEARDQAITQVETNTDPQWATICYNIIVNMPDTFTTDNIWQALEDAGVVAPREPRAVGGVLRRACVDGLIVASDRFVSSARVACHARPVRVWRRL